MAVARTFLHAPPRPKTDLLVFLAHLPSFLTPSTLISKKKIIRKRVISAFLLGVWMFIEGVTLLVKTSNRALRYSGSNKTKIRNQKLLLGWGLPAVLVTFGTTVGFATNSYMDEVEQYGYRRCWLNTNNAVFYVTVFGPLCFIYFVNILILIKILSFVYEMSKSSLKFQPTNSSNCSKSVFESANMMHIKATTKSFGLLFGVLGVPFIFTFLSGKMLLNCQSH